jgi:two-component system, OmpR family, sensor histidine kinase VicK
MSPKSLYSILIICLFVISCSTSKQKEQNVKKQFDKGIEYFTPLVTIFNKAELEKTTAAFRNICNQKPLTPTMKLQGYNCVFNSFERMKLYDSAALYADSCIIIIEQNKLEKYLPEFYYSFLLNKSTMLFKLRQPEQAIEIFYKVKKEVEMVDEPTYKFFLYEKLAFIAYQQKNFIEAADNFKKLIPLHTQTNPKDYYKKTEIVDNVGLSFFYANMIDSALATYKTALDTLNAHATAMSPFIRGAVYNKISYNHSLGVLLGNIANVFIIKKQYDSAILYSNRSIALNSELQGEKFDAQQVAMRLIDVYLVTKNLKEAELLLLKVKKSLDSLPDATVRMNWNKQMATLLENYNKPKQAYAYFKSYNTIKDSLNKLELKDAENDIVKDLQLKNQYADLSLLKKSNQLNQLYVFIAVGLVLVAIVVAFLIYSNYKKGKKKNDQLSSLNNELTQEKLKTEKALSKLEISNQDKDRILRVVAHDLRNPLSGIAAASKSILEADEEVYNKKLMMMIEKTSHHSLHLINELLQTHNHNEIELNKQTISINNLLQHCYSIIVHKAQEKQQNLALNLPRESFELSLDEAKMERVILNVINNAIKFTPVKGAIEMALLAVNNSCLISIKDNGIGIPKNEIEGVFEMFNQARKTGTAGEKSFGLGLSICKQIVEAHQGKIWVESEVGEGSCFYIQLPL